jgi:hypothetical protein
VRVRFAFGFVVVTVFSTTLMSACDINPQPEVPSDDDDGTGGEAGAPSGTPVQRSDDTVDEYDEVDPSAANFADKNDDGPDAAPDRPDAAMPPPYDARDDAGVPGVVN